MPLVFFPYLFSPLSILLLGLEFDEPADVSGHCITDVESRTFLLYDHNILDFGTVRVTQAVFGTWSMILQETKALVRSGV